MDHSIGILAIKQGTGVIFDFHILDFPAWFQNEARLNDKMYQIKRHLSESFHQAIPKFVRLITLPLAFLSKKMINIVKKLKAFISNAFFYIITTRIFIRTGFPLRRTKRPRHGIALLYSVFYILYSIF